MKTKRDGRSPTKAHKAFLELTKVLIARYRSNQRKKRGK